ncbi:MAG TPA: LPS export ABC transporter periplasmic protein LptC [Bacteroidales bacterium]|nr:LPS export ABC transporter periplasmic protein LptC [Bacteroidales bacterium]HRZ48750.1 LPS export ABC transporter periplasmic protein LptC [Bacteroidales bacterium]
MLLPRHAPGWFLAITNSLLGLIMIVSCTNDPEKVKELNKGKNLPKEWADDVTIHFSDSGLLRALITAPRLERYTDGRERYNLMPLGINARFFDSAGVEKSGIKAGYAVEFPDKRIVEARNNVQVVNETGDSLFTEYLVWNRNTRLISTEASVRIITHENEVIFGKNGMEADEKFTRWRIKHITESSLIIREGGQNP